MKNAIFSLDQIISWLIIYKYEILFPIAVIEGPIITVLAGFLVSMSYLNFFAVYLIVVFGDLVGDSLHYLFGRFWGKIIISRYGHYFGITEKRISRTKKHFKKHGGKTLLLGKLAQGIGGFILVLAGMVKMPFWRYIGFNLLGTLPKSFVLLLIGFYFGKVYARIDGYLNYLGLAIITLIILIILICLCMGYANKRFLNEG